MSRLAVIGGSGFTAMPGLEVLDYQQPDTPLWPGFSTGHTGPSGRCRDLLPLSARDGAQHTAAPDRLSRQPLGTQGLRCWASRRISGGIGGAFGPQVLAVPDQIIDYTYWAGP